MLIFLVYATQYTNLTKIFFDFNMLAKMIGIVIYWWFISKHSVQIHSNSKFCFDRFLYIFFFKMINLKKVIEDFRHFQAFRRKTKLDKMAVFTNVVLTINGVDNQFLVSIKVEDNNIIIISSPEGPQLVGILRLTQGDIIARLEMENDISITLDLYPPWPTFYNLKFKSLDVMRQFLKLIRASREPR